MWSWRTPETGGRRTARQGPAVACLTCSKGPPPLFAFVPKAAIRAALPRPNDIWKKEGILPSLVPARAQSPTLVVFSLWLVQCLAPSSGGRASRPPSRRKARRAVRRAGHFAACAGRTRLTARMEGGTPSLPMESGPGRQVDAVAGCERPCATSGKFKVRHYPAFASRPSLERRSETERTSVSGGRASHPPFRARTHDADGGRCEGL